MGAPRGYHHLAMRVKSFDTSVAFYTEVLGFKTGRSWGDPGKRAVMLEMADGGCLEIFEGGSDKDGNQGETTLLHFALRVDDCDSLLESVRASGAKITVEAKDVDIPSDPVYPVRIAFFEGPDREIVELFQER